MELTRTENHQGLVTDYLGGRRLRIGADCKITTWISGSDD